MSFTLYRPACSCGWRSIFLVMNPSEALLDSRRHADVQDFYDEHIPLAVPEQQPSDES